MVYRFAETPAEQATEGEKPSDYSTLLFYVLLDTTRSFKEDPAIADSAVQALKALLLPYADKEYYRTYEAIEKNLDEVRQRYMRPVVGAASQYRWMYISAVNKQFEHLVQLAERVYLLGGRRGRKLEVLRSNYAED